MKPDVLLTHEFVESIPQALADRTIYISIPFATAIHKCCCGCGNQVVTPISPTDWKLIFDGVSVSLQPSIGNWSFACQSHYWVTHNRVKWAPMWSKDQIQLGRDQDVTVKAHYYGDAITESQNDTPGQVPANNTKQGIWHWFKTWWS
jgi:hypothetical protein